jgi:two-component system, cell cycle sensor histidine kinase and response regulator CckA
MVRSIKQAEEILKIISENISDMIVITDVRRKRISANASYERLFDPAQPFTGSDFITNVHSDDHEVVKSNFQEAVTVGYTGTFTYRFVMPGGTYRLLTSKIIRVLDERDNPRNLIVISKDVTEMHQSEQEIRLLAETVSSTKDAFFLTDFDDKFLFVNPTAGSMYGYKDDELIGEKISKIQSESMPEDLKTTIRQKTMSGGWSGEVLNKRADGSDFYAEIWTSLVHDEHDQPVAITTVIRDISDRKLAEQKLEQTAERLRLTLDHLGLVAFEFDVDGKISLARGRGLDKLGLSQDRFVGSSIFDLYPQYPDLLNALRDAYKGVAQEIELVLGTFIWSANFIPMKDESGVVERVFCTAVDITARKRAEETLSRETNLWHTLMDNIPDTIYFKDLHSRFIRNNKAHCMVLGVKSMDEVLGKTDDDFFSPEHSQKTRADEDYVIRTGEQLIGIVEKVTTKDGRSRWLSTTKIPIRDKQGNISGIMGSSRDITDIKQAEELESALYRIAEESASSEDLPKLFEAIHRIIGHLMYARNFFIALYDWEKDILAFPYFVDEIDTPPEAGTVGRSLSAYVLRTGKSLLCDQQKSDELERSGEAELVGVPSPIWLGVPLNIEGKTIGVMVVQHYSDPSAYSEREQHILEFVSTQIAKAIERKRATEALQESDERYRAFIEQSSEGIWRFTTDIPISITLPEEEQVQLFFDHFYLEECNDAMALMYGYSRASDITGLKMHDMLVPYDPRNKDVFRKFIQSGYRLTQVETHEFDRLGNIKIFANNFVAILDGAMIRGCWGTQVDVTEHRQAEEMLMHSEEKYRTLFEESYDCIILSTPDGRLLDINPAGVKLFGYDSKDEMLNLAGVAELYANPQDRETFISHFEQYAFVKDHEIAVRRKDNQHRIVLENSSAIRDANGNIAGYRSFLRDITERKNLEDQLRQAQKMESIGTLAGGIAHEFNNILGIILGYTSILENKNIEPIRMSQGIETIKKAVQRGAVLVRQLLTFARKGETTFISMDVNAMVLELIEMLKQTFPKTIVIDPHLAAKLPFIEADSSQLHLALLNLCLNARDAMTDTAIGNRGGGTLTIETGTIPKEAIKAKFPDATNDSYVSISVVDTGIGMDEETRNRIFEPFFTTKELGKGTGLGLAVVYGVVNSHHGFVSVESTKGVGTSFTIYLPSKEVGVQLPLPPTTSITEVKRGNEMILVVEDEEMLSLLLKSILEEKGYRVTIAKDGQEGLDIYREQKNGIDLVLSDMGLPRLGGYEMFMEMKELNPDIKVILASGYFEPNLKVDLVAAGAKDFIQKPYIAESIINRIREVLDES